MIKMLDIIDLVKSLGKKFETNKELYFKMAKFFDEMIKIQEEKQPQYQDTWKECKKYDLLQQLEKQLEKFKDFGQADNKEDGKRRLLHLANYCFFLYTRLGE